MMLKVKLTEEAQTLHRGTKYSTGLDLKSIKEYILKPMERVLIETGVHVQPEEPYISENGNTVIPDLQIRPRSGLSSKGLIVHLGSIDLDFTGMCKVSMINLSGEEYKVNIGDKVGQLVYGFAGIPEIEYVDNLDETERGSGSFGSTGK